MDQLYDLNKNWLLISGNDDETDYHQTRIDENKAYKAVTPSFPHMYIEDHTGITWYQQEFFLEELPDKDHIAMVTFECATLKTDVSVNGKMVGTHIGNEDPFKFDVTDALKKGDNIICVRTSKPDARDIDGYNFFEIPHRNETAEGLMPGANFNISGIYGDVWLKVIPKVYIDDVYLIADHKTGNIQVRMTAINKYNDKKKVKCFVKAGKTTDGYTTEINSVTALTNPCETLITTDITIDNYELWSTENPILYNVYTEIKTDCTEQSLITRTGFRYFEIREDGYFYLNAMSITGLLDHSICGEGLWTIYRKYKPYMADVMQMGFSDAMWCIITPKASVNKGEEFSVEALISSVDVLKTGKTYPARLSIEKDGVTYAYREYSVTVPDSNSFVIPVLNQQFDTSSYPEGEYTLHLEIDGCDVCNNTKKFTVINPVMSKTKRKVLCIDIDEEMFTQYGFKIAKRYSEGAIVAVRSVTKKNFKKIQEYLSKGATVVCFKATADDDISVNLLPENRRPGKVLTNDWLYHKEYVVNYESPFFDRMPAGVMDCDLYGDFFNHYSLDAEGEAVLDITHAMSFCTGYPVKSGYTGGFSMGTYNLECGRLVLNTFDLLESELPYAKKIFVNMIDNA